MNKKIVSALISVFHKDGLDEIVRQLASTGVALYSTGGTQKYIEALGLKVTPVETLTSYPSILGGRVKTLHPGVFGGILARRNVASDLAEMEEFHIPAIDLIIVDLYPFKQTVAQTRDENQIIEKIDIGGPSLIRAAAKNFEDVAVLAAKEDYPAFLQMLKAQEGSLSLPQRRSLAGRAFKIVADYDSEINHYFNGEPHHNFLETGQKNSLRYGENPHQLASFYGDLHQNFTQLHGKEISYNNLVDIEAAMAIIEEFSEEHKASSGCKIEDVVFAIIKHTNVCGIACRPTTAQAWKDALAGDPESAFGGVLVCNSTINEETAGAINELFFEVLLAPSFSKEALEILKTKKNRVLLELKTPLLSPQMYKSLLNGTLVQQKDEGNYQKWEEIGPRPCQQEEKENLKFANIVCKHLKSNAIVLIKNKQLIGKGCGQTSRIDALRQSIEKARQFHFDLNGAVMASDAFFPFNDCVRMGHQAGVTAFIQPGGSIRDKESIDYCKQNNLAMVLTGMRHFKH
ncbi:MAG: bifunctional phosphoribosylaminoimidazolecarboxamide formyltransferase/IMP cyclohydrolase [Flavisolibacter sp.]